jgi:aminoglycoside phosphotransferase (APT) family kinase protein
MSERDAMMMASLQAFFAHALDGAPASMDNLVDASGGRSRENWSFDLSWPHSGELCREPLILRRDPPGGLVETDRSQEFEVLRALEGTAVPSPPVRWLDADGKWFGRPSLIMRRLPGSCDYYVLTGDRPLAERKSLAQQFSTLLAEVHAVDWTALDERGVLLDPGAGAAEAELDHWEAVLRRDQPEAYPELELALQQLHRAPPRAEERVLVHGDFKPGNVLLEGDRIVALLDWELAHLGDPMEDLGWMTQPLRLREQIIPGSWEEADIFASYERATGRVVDPASVRWWNMFATFRTAVMQVSGLRSFLEGRSPQAYRPTAKVLRTLIDYVDD